ncbi:MAG: DUF4304 domain-containing protein [Acidobacteriota bacterium]
MPCAKSPLQKLFDDVVRRGVTSMLRPYGFRKSGLNFHRRNGDVIQVVNLQNSHGSSPAAKRFYINVGLSFDDLCRLTGTEQLDRPKEYECEGRGTRARLEELIDDVPERWEVRANRDAPGRVLDNLKPALAQLACELQIIENALSYRRHRWFERSRPSQENAQILYLLGDREAAWNEVLALCALFRDRKTMSRPGWWLRKLGLAELARSRYLSPAEKAPRRAPLS